MAAIAADSFIGCKYFSEQLSQRITGWWRGAPLPGKPDFVFRAQKVAVFVDGCFWHGCPRHGRTPKTRVAFWTAKLVGNAQRDRAVSRALRAAGWTVLRVWECALSRQRSGHTVARIVRTLAERKAAR
jgi:DNA mismatch endonuclease (patch repair protein)